MEYEKVIFRVWKDAGDVIALFPRIAASENGYLCQSYMHVGGHGGAIKGNKLDLFFPTHKAALEWGRRKIIVKIVE